MPEKTLEELDLYLKALKDLTEEAVAKRDALLRDLELECRTPRYPYQKCCGGSFKVRDANIIQTYRIRISSV